MIRLKCANLKRHRSLGGLISGLRVDQVIVIVFRNWIETMRIMLSNFFPGTSYSRFYCSSCSVNL